MDLLERIESWGRRRPERLAHISGTRQLTYRALVQRSDAVATYLTRTLSSDDSPVAVLGHKEPEMLIGFLGAAKAGRAYVPLDTSLPRHRIEQIVARARVRVTLTPELINSLPEMSPPRERRRRPEDPYYIIFTSGSTGEPKGVVITLGCLESFVDWMLTEQGLTDDARVPEVFLNQAPFSFDLSVMDLYLSLASGGTLFSITQDDIANPKHLFRALSASEVTTWVSTPSFAQMCLVERSFGAGMIPGVRRFLFCGETLAPETAGELLERFPASEVWNTYGPTEATVATTSIRVDRDLLERYPALPVGHPKPGTRVLVVDESLRPVPLGERGEIVIAGPNVSPGYLGRPDLTERSFFQLDGRRAYHTGDWGRFKDGLLFFEGRMDGQLKLHGYRIEIGDVEANLRALPGVRDAVIVPTIKQGCPDSLMACVILSERPPGSDFEVSRILRSQLAERLPSYMLPRKFCFLETFPITGNGKADRRKLVEALA